MPAKKTPSTFSQPAARRVARVVRLFERGNRDIHAAKFRTAWDEGTPVKVGRTQSAWSVGTTQEVEIIYAGDCEAEGEPTTLQAWNRLWSVAANRIVILAQAENGCWYMVGAASDPAGAECHTPSIGGEDLRQLPGYDTTKTQLLGHISGCLQWFDTYSCPAET